MGILIVCHDRADRLYIEEVLRATGFLEITSAESASEAIAILAPNCQAPFELLLIDLALPQGEVLALCRRINNDGREGDPTIVALASDDQFKALEPERDCGPFDYVSKPFDKTALLARVRSALRLKAEIDRNRIRDDALAKFEFIANASRDLMTLVRRDYVYEAANKAYLDTLDPGREGIVGRSVAQVWGTKLFQGVIKPHLDECLAGREVHYEAWFDFHNRGRGYYDVVYYPYVGEPGRVTHAVVVSHEITGRRQAEEELRRSRNTLDSIIRNIPDIVYRLDPEGRITFISDAVKNYGYDPAALIGSPIMGLVHPDNRPEATWRINERRTGDRSTKSIELRLLTTDRAEVPFETRWRDIKGFRLFNVSAEGVYDLDAPASEGFTGTQGIARDVTEFKQAAGELERYKEHLEELVLDRTRQLETANQAFQSSEEKYRALVDALQDGIFSTDQAGTVVFANRAMAGIFGYGSPDDIVGRNIFRIEAFEDPDQFKVSLGSMRDPAQFPEVIETALTSPDGRTRWIEVRPTPIVDGGRVAGSRAIVRDVTERRGAEARLKVAKEEWEKTFDAVPDLIAILDREHRIVRANQAMADRLGLTTGELAGRPCYETVHGAIEPIADCPHHHLLSDGRMHVADVYEDRLGGDFHVTVSPLFGPDGALTGSVHVARDITESKRAEALLRASEERYRDLFNNISDLIMTHDLEGKLLSANPAASAVAGFSPEEMIGKLISDFIAPDFRPLFKTEYLKRILTEGEAEGVLLALDKDGREHYIEYRNTLVKKAGAPAYVSGSARNITERVRAERALQQSRNFAELIYRLIPSAIFTVDREARITSWNDQAARITGYSEEEMLGQTCLVFAQSPCTDRCGVFDPDTPKPIRGRECTLRTKDGRILTVLKNADLIEDEAGQVLGGIESFSDITERKQAEDELVLAREEAEQANRAKSEFLANMSHEIRTPMNAILGMTDLALMTDLDGEQRGFLETVKSSADALLQIINDILDISKIEAGFLTLNDDSFDLRSLVDSIMKALAIKAHQKGIEFVQDFREGAPVHIRGDANRLRQVLLNLIGNAIKFTERGQVVLTVEPMDRDTIHFKIADTGIGIPAKTLDRIFDRFTQADGSITRRFGGTGLGTTIAKQLVELMNGRIWAESEPGRGSTFHFTIKAVPGDSRTGEGPDFRKRLKGLRVLIADAGSANRTMIGQTLSAWGMIPVTANDASAALEKLQDIHRTKGTLDLALLDMGLPDLDGIELARRIRLHEAWGDLPIIFLTSMMDKFEDRGFPGPRTKMLAKPVGIEELLETIMRVAGLGMERELPMDRWSPPRVSRKKLNILLAEDNLFNQKLAVTLLEKRGHQVITAENGRAALEIWERESFDLILMDVQMPEMDGLEATRSIRARETLAGAHVPIVAMTAHAMESDQDRCLEAGMDAYVSKPIDVDEFFTTIESLVPDGPDTAIENDSVRPGNEVLNRAALMALTEGDIDLIEELIDLFQADLPDRLAEIRSAIQDRDARRLEYSAHTLKGMIHSFSATSAAQAALKLETAGRSGNLDAAGEDYQTLTGELDRLKAALLQTLSSLKA